MHLSLSYAKNGFVSQLLIIWAQILDKLVISTEAKSLTVNLKRYEENRNWNFCFYPCKLYSS